MPLSLPREQWPTLLPLRVAFDTRASVDGALSAAARDTLRAARVCAMALASHLKELPQGVDKRRALTLALETINGMAKTAPMKTEAIDTPSPEVLEAQRKVVKMGWP